MDTLKVVKPIPTFSSQLILQEVLGTESQLISFPTNLYVDWMISADNKSFSGNQDDFNGEW